MSDAGKPWQGYAAEADRGAIFERYEGLSSAKIAEPVAHLIPPAPARVLDVGAGTGRDAAWFASLGHQVVAAEPVDALRDFAERTHASPGITWLADGLPTLEAVRAHGGVYDLIWLSGVWMHLDKAQRRAGLPVLAGLLAPGGHLVMFLRHGPVPAGRRMFDVTAAETTALAEAEGLEPVFEQRAGSLQAANKRAGVQWTRIAFRA